MRSKIIMAVAIVAIVAGLFGLFFPKQNAQPVVAESQELAPVFFKAYVLSPEGVKQGDQVKRSDFKIIKMAEEEANALGYDADMLFDFEAGSVYANNIEQGEHVFIENLVQPSQAKYIDFIIKPDHVPFAIEVSPSSIVGGVISSGSYIDILALTGQDSASNELGNYGREQVSINPVLTHIKVLKVEQPKTELALNSEQIEPSYLILELNRKQVAVLTVAKTISKIEVHKTIGHYPIHQLQADAGDVLPDFKAIKELRAEKIAVN